MVLMRGIQCGTLYKLLGRIVTDGCNSSIFPNSKNEQINVPNVFGEDTVQWNRRLGRIRENGFQSLQGKSMVEGMSNCKFDFYFCEYCLYGKQNQVKFPARAA